MFCDSTSQFLLTPLTEKLQREHASQPLHEYMHARCPCESVKAEVISFIPEGSRIHPDTHPLLTTSESEQWQHHPYTSSSASGMLPILPPENTASSSVQHHGFEARDTWLSTTRLLSLAW